MWSSEDVSTGGRYIKVAGLPGVDSCALIGESFHRAPEIARIAGGEYVPVASFDIGYGTAAAAISSVDRLTWQAPDGLEIHGWLLRPRGPAPYPLVMLIHGGPVFHWRTRFQGRAPYLHALFLVMQGYAVFLPNPRGSGGNGQSYAREVLGDMAGADTYDYLSGIDMLVESGFADPDRLGVMGGSYGGYMASWLVTQDRRFATAVPCFPVTNKVSQHLISNIPEFISMFLDDRYDNPNGKYFQRSPIMHARNARTPTLNVCGALDRCTPPEEAIQFHNALLQNGCESALLTYPQEGHGIRHLPASIDFIARVAGWFQHHMPSTAPATHSIDAGVPKYVRQA